MKTLEVKTYYDKDRVAEFIKSAKESQKSLAQAVGCTPTTISRVIAGTASQVLLAKLGARIGFDYREVLLPAESILGGPVEKSTSGVDG